MTAIKSSSPSTSPSYRLWLNSNFYIELDGEGYCLSDCIEGAMGYIIRCHSGQPGGADGAWKLPRLIADTQRENAYIAQLLEGERSNICRIGNRAQKLIRYHAIDNPLELCTIGIRPLDVDPSTCAADQRILVRFSKGKRPRFCGVQRIADGEPRVVPEAAIRLAREEWERLTCFLCGDAQGVGRFAPVLLADPRVLPTGHARAAYVNFEPSLLSQVVESEKARRGWYIGLPTILYDWANGTLQDAISNRRRRAWTTRHHLLLIERLLSGLCTLHSAGMLHGDIRPANIMFLGDPSDPDNFILIDVGSLASGNSSIVGAAESEFGADKTILGAITNARASAFYAPERRQAFEHEDGDITIIAPDPRDRGSFIVAIGWRSRIDDETGAPSERLPFSECVELLLHDWIDALDQPRAADTFDVHARLCPGDRVRLREYVFNVLEPPLAIGGFSVMRCKASVSKVWNERLVVPLLDFWSEFRPSGVHGERFVHMALPKVIEISQWSQATDLFSIGVVLLYSIYGQDHPVPSRVECEFTEMLDIFANPLYFSRMWPHIDRVCAALERLVEDRPGIAAAEFREAPSGIDMQAMQKRREGASQPDTIYYATLNMVQHITQTAPHARELVVRGFGGNIAEFLLFVHFVFSCLHRKSDLVKYDSGGSAALPREYPFSDDRTSRDPRSTERAFQRARKLRELYIQGVFREMCAGGDELPDYRPVSQSELLLEITRIEQELNEARSKFAKLRELAEQLREEQRSGFRIGSLRIHWLRKRQARAPRTADASDRDEDASP